MVSGTAASPGAKAKARCGSLRVSRAREREAARAGYEARVSPPRAPTGGSVAGAGVPRAAGVTVPSAPPAPLEASIVLARSRARALRRVRRLRPSPGSPWSPRALSCSACVLCQRRRGATSRDALCSALVIAAEFQFLVYPVAHPKVPPVRGSSKEFRLCTRGRVVAPIAGHEDPGGEACSELRCRLCNYW
eukprot:COSAG03_NODE_178_length_11063_cov_43.316951_10_plen_191_part_00